MSDLRIPLDYKETNLPRGAWSLSQPVITSLMQGLNVFIKGERLYPKDDVDVNFDFIMQSMPMVGQLLNDWKLRVFCFKSRLSNYYGWLDNNTKMDLDGRVHHYISPSSAINSGVSDQGIRFTGLFYDFFGFSYAPQYSVDTLYLFTSIMNVVPTFSHMMSIHPDDAEWVSPSREYNIDYDFARYLSVQQNSLLDMIGLPSGFIGSRSIGFSDLTPDDGLIVYPYSSLDCFNADYILAYLDAHRNYLVNNQYGYLPYLYYVPDVRISQSTDYKVNIHKPVLPRLGQLRLDEIDKFFMLLRQQNDGCDIFKLAFQNKLDGIVCWLMSLKFGGHFCSQYERDMLTTLLYDNNTGEVFVKVDENGNFSINQLRFMNRQQKKVDRETVAGGRYKDRLRTVWGSESHRELDIPELVGVNSYVVSPRGVVSTTDTFDVESGTGASIGQLAGVVNTDSHSKYKFSIYSDDDSLLFFMVQLVPDVVYCNGLGKYLDVHSFDAEYTPQFDQLGFQDVPLYKYNVLPTYELDSGKLLPSEINPNKVVGKNIAFIDLISNVGRAHGVFSNDGYFDTWVLKRTFDNDTHVNVRDENGDPISTYVGTPVKSISPYINPLKYQYPFTVQDVKDNNFVFMFGLDMRVVRSKGKSYMPTLG